MSNSYVIILLQRKILYEVSLEELIREYMTLQRPPSPEY
jgi:hypothetical protein